jgi:hypothetical protein
VNRDFVTRSRYREGGTGLDVVVQHAKSCPSTKSLAIFLCFYCTVQFTNSTRRRGVDEQMAASWSKRGHFIGISAGNYSRPAVSTIFYLIQPAVSCTSFHLTIPLFQTSKPVCAQNNGSIIDRGSRLTEGTSLCLRPQTIVEDP